MEDDQRLHTLVHEVTLYGLRFTIARSRKTAVTDRTVIIIVVGKLHRRKSLSTHFAVAALVYCMHHSAVKPHQHHLVYYFLHDFLHEHS